jgi:hypothetical protein
LLLVGIVLFWGARLVIQPLVFDPVLRLGAMRSPLVRAGASFVWGFYVAVYGAALLAQYAAAPSAGGPP